MKDFIRRHLKRGFKFAMIGTLGAIESLILQYLLTEFMGIHYMLSSVFGIGLAMFNNYFLNYYLNFKVKEE